MRVWRTTRSAPRRACPAGAGSRRRPGTRSALEATARSAIRIRSRPTRAATHLPSRRGSRPRQTPERRGQTHLALPRLTLPNREPSDSPPDEPQPPRRSAHEGYTGEDRDRAEVVQFALQRRFGSRPASNLGVLSARRETGNRVGYEHAGPTSPAPTPNTSAGTTRGSQGRGCCARRSALPALSRSPVTSHSTTSPRASGQGRPGARDTVDQRLRPGL